MASNGLAALQKMFDAPSVMEQFENVLKEGRAAFYASVIDLYNSNDELQQCDNKLIVKECLRAAAMHLPINKALGYAWLIVFNNTVKEKYTDEKGVERERQIKVKTPTFLTSAKGLTQLALRSRIYTNINHDVIYEGELVEKDKLTGEIILDEKQRKSDKVIGYFAHFETFYGMKKTLYMTVEQVARFAKLYSPTCKYSQNITVDSLMKLAGQPPRGYGWTGDFDSMARKTVLRQLLEKYGELNTEIQAAITTERNVESAAAEPQTPTTTAINVQDVKYEDVTDEPKAEPQPQPQPEVKKTQTATQVQCQFA